MTDCLEWVSEVFAPHRSAPDTQAWGKYFTRLAELITSLNIPQRLHWAERAIWTNWSCAWALYKGERGYWPDPPSNAAQLNPTCEGTSSPQQTPRELYARRGGIAQAVASMRISSGRFAWPIQDIIHWDLFSGSKVRGANNQGVLEHAGLSPVSFCFTLAVCGTVTRGGSRSRLWWRCMGAHWAADCVQLLGMYYLINWAEGFGKKR